MCYAIPGKIKEILNRAVLVDYFGEERRVLNEFDNLAVGDYVYAQGGYVIRKVAVAEAEDVLAAWRELFFELREVDLRLSGGVDFRREKTDPALGRILDRAMEGKTIGKEELLELLRREDPSELDIIFRAANFLRQKHLRNACCVHGILEISNHCSEDCAYCGISTRPRGVSRYRMTPEEIVQAAMEAVETYGFKALVLQSGENPGYSFRELANIIRTIKEKAPALIFVSFGEVGLDGLEELFAAGARGLLLRFETSSPELYAGLHSKKELETRLAHLRRAYEIGYLIATGSLVGLPGQTKEDLANDIVLARELHAEMFSFGPFLPVPGTSLAGYPRVREIDMLKVIAAARLADPENGKILVTTAFETLSPDARRKGLLAGANSMMLNVTPVHYRKDYTIYPNRAHEKDDIADQIEGAIALLKDLGRAPTDLGI